MLIRSKVPTKYSVALQPRAFGNISSYNGKNSEHCSASLIIFSTLCVVVF